MTTAMSDEIRTYTELQREIHDALRTQHPEWIQPSGECPTCDGYELRLAKLLNLFTPNEDQVAA